MNPQVIFDTVAKHLFSQGKRSRVDGECKYRGPDGTSCAIGCVISDEEYNVAMEGNGVHHLAYDGLLPAGLAANIDLLVYLQRIHDSLFSWADSETMRYALMSAGNKFGLDVSQVASMSFGDR